MRGKNTFAAPAFSAPFDCMRRKRAINALDQNVARTIYPCPEISFLPHDKKLLAAIQGAALRPTAVCEGNEPDLI